MTGNCSWDGYQSLAICSQCTNITDLVQVNRFCSHSHNESCGWRLPNGLSIDYDRILRSHNAVMNTTCNGDSLDLQNLGYVIANFTRLDGDFQDECQFNRSQNALECTHNAIQVRATECVLFWCLNKYTATVKDSDLIETRISSWWNRSDHSAVSIPYSGSSFYQMRPIPSDWPDRVWPQYLTGDAKEVGDEISPLTLNDNATDIQTFSVDQSGHEAFSGWLRSLLTLSNTGLQEQSSFDPDSDLVDILLDVGPYGNEDGLDRTPQLFGNISQRITQYMRQQYGQSTTSAALYNELGIAFATGNTTGYRTVVHVRWGWIVYPVILVGLTTLFTIATISSTAKRNMPAWKSSTLALMLRGPFSRTISSSEADLEKRAGNTKTHLKKTDRGWRMVKDVDGTR